MKTMNNIQFVRKSGNAKTGPIPTTTSSRSTCPEVCPFNHGKGCYAEAGYYTRMNWDKVTNGERGASLDHLCSDVAKLPEGQLWRHNVAGDLIGLADYKDQIDNKALIKLTKANKGKRGFTYTHYPTENRDNVAAIRGANEEGFTVNASANNIDHALEIKQAYPDLPVVTVAPSDYDSKTRIVDGVKFITCPATYKDDITCASCKLCSVSERDSVVCFPAHGTQSKQADIIARG